MVLHHILKDFSKPGSAKNRYCHPGAPDPEKAILSCELAVDPILQHLYALHGYGDCKLYLHELCEK